MKGWVDGWRHWLTKYTNKDSEHIPQHYYISHNHPYISSSDMLGGTIRINIHCYLCRDG